MWPFKKKPTDAQLAGQISTLPIGAGFVPGIGPAGAMIPEGFGCDYGAALTGSTCEANGGNACNPLGFPGYDALYGQAFWTYWWMLQHPVLRLARAVSCSPIQASTWTFEKFSDDIDEAEEEELASLLSRNLLPLRRDIVNHALRGRDFGRAPFEPVWDVVSTKANGSEYRLVDMVPLPVETTGVYRDERGRFAGLAASAMLPAQQQTMVISGQANGAGETPGLPAPYKAWLYVYDDYARMLLGRSWLENVRQLAWRPWLDTAQQLTRLEKKLSGIFSVITGPAGEIPGSKGSDGKPIKYADAANRVINNFATGGHGAFMPTFSIPLEANAGNVDVMKLLVQLMRSSLITFENLDFGNNAPAVLGMLQVLEHYETLMFDGALMPPRTAQQGKHGTQAEAGQHTDTATTTIQNDNEDIAHQAQPLVDAILVLNKGEKYAGTMRVKAEEIERPKIQAQIDLFKAALASTQPGVFQEVSETIDVTNFLRGINFQIARPYDTANVADAAMAAKPPAPPPGQDPNAQDVPPGLANRMGAANKLMAKKMNGKSAKPVNSNGRGN